MTPPPVEAKAECGRFVDDPDAPGLCVGCGDAREAHERCNNIRDGYKCNYPVCGCMYDGMTSEPLVPLSAPTHQQPTPASAEAKCAFCNGVGEIGTPGKRCHVCGGTRVVGNGGSMNYGEFATLPCPDCAPASAEGREIVEALRLVTGYNAVREHPVVRDAIDRAIHYITAREGARSATYQRTLQFFSKHALGPLARPSCLVCGKPPEVWPPAIQHMELPAVVVCHPCRDAVAALTPQSAPREAIPDSLREAMLEGARALRAEAFSHDTHHRVHEGRGGWDKARDECEANASALEAAAAPRPCTCHPDDNPPRPCPRKYALSDCRAAAGGGS